LVTSLPVERHPIATPRRSLLKRFLEDIRPLLSMVGRQRSS
jgi:hypothetical protein